MQIISGETMDLESFSNPPTQARVNNSQNSFFFLSNYTLRFSFVRHLPILCKLCLLSVRWPFRLPWICPWPHWRLLQPAPLEMDSGRAPLIPPLLAALLAVLLAGAGAVPVKQARRPPPLEFGPPPESQRVVTDSGEGCNRYGWRLAEVWWWCADWMSDLSVTAWPWNGINWCLDKRNMMASELWYYLSWCPNSVSCINFVDYDVIWGANHRYDGHLWGKWKWRIRILSQVRLG